MSHSRLGAWPRPILSMVIGHEPGVGPLEGLVSAAFGSGADWLQLRERRLDTNAFLAWARPLIRAAQAAAGKRPTAMIINRRNDIARVLSADGVQLGFDALASEDARTFLGDRALIGVSTHYKDEIGPSLQPGADYVQFAPIFPPLSKRGDRDPAGLDGLASACSRGLPVLAQGGIDETNAASVIRAGARGIAVTGAITRAADPGAATATLRAELDAG